MGGVGWGGGGGGGGEGGGGGGKGGGGGGGGGRRWRIRKAGTTAASEQVGREGGELGSRGTLLPADGRRRRQVEGGDAAL